MCLSNFFKKLLFVSYLALAPLEATCALPSSAALEEVEVHLAAEIDVAGDRVVLGDVATIYAKSMQDFRALSSLVLSQIPEDKHELRLPSSYLSRRIRESLPVGAQFNLKAPQEIVFRLKRLGVSEREFSAELLRLARAYGKVPEGIEAEVLPLSGFEQLKLYHPGAFRIEPAGEIERWKGDLAFRVIRFDKQDGGPAFAWVKVRLRWFQQAWVASRSLNFFQPMDPTQFSLQRVETTAMREDPLPAATVEQLAEALKNSRVRRSIAANSALFASHLEKKPDAPAGKNLRVVFISESGVQVSADGSLVMPGAIGNEVKARLRSSRKVVTGKLVSEGVVEVSL